MDSALRSMQLQMSRKWLLGTNVTWTTAAKSPKNEVLRLVFAIILDEFNLDNSLLFFILNLGLSLCWWIWLKLCCIKLRISYYLRSCILNLYEYVMLVSCFVMTLVLCCFFCKWTHLLYFMFVNLTAGIRI